MRNEARKAGKGKILKGSISNSQEFELYLGDEKPWRLVVGKVLSVVDY